MSIGKNIAKFRKQLNLTQEELDELLKQEQEAEEGEETEA